MLMLSTALLLSTVLVQDAPQADRAARPHVHTHAAGETGEAESPILFEVTYTGETMSNVSGGLRRGTRYLDNLDMVLNADLGGLAGWRGANVHVYGLYNNGASIAELAGDAQAVSNLEAGTRALRLYEAWIDQTITPGLSLRAGLYDLNSEFDALDASGLFVGSAHGIGSDFSQAGQSGPSIFPSTSLAARIEVRPAKGWAIRAAILDGVPGDPARPERTVIRFGRGDGALVVGEVETPLLGARLLVGHWRYTAAFETLDGGRAYGNAGVYLRGEAPLLDREGKQIAAFFRLGAANGDINMFDRFASAGIKMTGWIAGRPEDEVGVAFASAFTSRPYRLSAPSTGSETAIEATYRTGVAPWLTLQPSVQYIRNPSADPSIGGAWVLGLRSEISFRLLD
ncbi:MAG: carbohydrate porin [Sphingomonadales bacterium]|nr:MAG: carbohydrate porin [Sphingomonadales bacterium]